MVIIGFVIAVMIFSSFSIVFNNSGNNLNKVKSNNLSVKSFTSYSNITIASAKIDANTPIEFYSNFMLFVKSNNDLYLENLTSKITINTELTYNTYHGNNYYGLTIYNNILYVYLADPYNIYLNSFHKSNMGLISSYGYSSSGYCTVAFGLVANSNNIYAFMCNNANPVFKEFSYSLTLIRTTPSYTNITISNSNYSGYVMGNFYIFYVNGNLYMFNLNNFVLYNIQSSYGELIYNNTYKNTFYTLTNDSNNNIYISNNINYGCIYNKFYYITGKPEPQLYNNRRFNGGVKRTDVSFINANFYNNAYVNFSGYLKYNNTYAVKLGSYTLPYTILNNSIYYAINSYTYGIEYLNTYILNIKSYNHNSNQIKDYFFYNNNIYYGNEFNFTNDNGIFSVLPLNYSVYVYNGSYITTSSSEFKTVGNGIYEYNLSIYYSQESTKLPKNPIAFGSYTELLTYLFIFFAVISLVFMTKKYGFDNNSKRGKK